MNSHMKVISIMVSVLGIIGQVSQSLGGTALPGNWNLVVLGLGAVATDILHVLQQLQNQPPSTPTPTATATVTAPASTVAPATKVGVFILGLFLLTGSCLASGLSLGPMNAQTTGNEWMVFPVTDAALNLSSANSYGLSYNEVIGYANVTPVDSTHALVNPYGFVGLSVSADLGEWAKTAGNAPIALDYGFIVGLPKLDVTLPEVSFSLLWNSVSDPGFFKGKPGIFLDLSTPTEVLSDVMGFIFKHS